MKRYSTLKIFLFIGILCQLFSCRKLADELLKDKDADLRICNIRSITLPDDEGDLRKLTFSYNSHGDPVYIHNSISYTPYSAHYYFRYNNKRQLTDLITLNEYKQVVGNWTKYYYSSSGTLLLDTTWSWGEFGSQPDPQSQHITITQYSFDSKKRISGVSGKTISYDGGDEPESFFHQSFVYDKNGNLSGFRYDNGINIFRTNRIWQMITRDYSMNNAISGASYNSWGLPVKITGGDLDFFFFNLADNSRIEYECPE